MTEKIKLVKTLAVAKTKSICISGIWPVGFCVCLFLVGLEDREGGALGDSGNAPST